MDDPALTYRFVRARPGPPPPLGLTPGPRFPIPRLLFPLHAPFVTSVVAYALGWAFGPDVSAMARAELGDFVLPAALSFILSMAAIMVMFRTWLFRDDLTPHRFTQALLLALVLVSAFTLGSTVETALAPHPEVTREHQP